MVSIAGEDRFVIAIIDYGVGNLFSVEKAFARFADDVKLTSAINDIVI